MALAVYCRENSEEKIFTSNASGWAGAATGKDKNLYGPRGISVSKYKNDNFGNMDWLATCDSLQTIEIVLPNTIHGCKRKNLKHL